MDLTDLVAIQNNQVEIRNPFGFDFVCRWNNKPFRFQGYKGIDNAPFKATIKPLADHITRHLYMKIRYQYHDEQVFKLRKMGMREEARKFNVSAEVENKIWWMITGQPLHQKTAIGEEEAVADLTELNKSLKLVDQEAAGNGKFNHVSNVSELIHGAMADVIGDPNTQMVGDGEAVRVKGSIKTSMDEVPEDNLLESQIQAASQAEVSNPVGIQAPTDLENPPTPNQAAQPGPQLEQQPIAQPQGGEVEFSELEQLS